MLWTFSCTVWHTYTCRQVAEMYTTASYGVRLREKQAPALKLQMPCPFEWTSEIAVELCRFQFILVKELPSSKYMEAHRGPCTEDSCLHKGSSSLPCSCGGGYKYPTCRKLLPWAVGHVDGAVHHAGSGEAEEMGLRDF